MTVATPDSLFARAYAQRPNASKRVRRALKRSGLAANAEKAAAAANDCRDLRALLALLDEQHAAEEAERAVAKAQEFETDAALAPTKEAMLRAEDRTEEAYGKALYFAEVAAAAHMRRVRMLATRAGV